MKIIEIKTKQKIDIMAPNPKFFAVTHTIRSKKKTVFFFFWFNWLQKHQKKTFFFFVADN